MKALLNWLNAYRLLPVVLAFTCGALLGTAQSFAGKGKDEFAIEEQVTPVTEQEAVSVTEDEAPSATEDKSPSANGRMGKTVFVDISAFGRRKRAANRMTELHEKFAEEGWTVVDVAVYTENNDLEGFFVTYVKE